MTTPKPPVQRWTIAIAYLALLVLIPVATVVLIILMIGLVA